MTAVSAGVVAVDGLLLVVAGGMDAWSASSAVEGGLVARGAVLGAGQANVGAAAERDPLAEEIRRGDFF